MTLWSDFLRRLMIGASLSAPAVSAGADDGVAANPPAEVGSQQPDRGADAPQAEMQQPGSGAG